MIIVYCKNCGKQFHGNFVSCPYCGAKAYQSTTSLEPSIGDNTYNQQEHPDFKNPFHGHNIIDDSVSGKGTIFLKIIVVIGIIILVFGSR